MILVVVLEFGGGDQFTQAGDREAEADISRAGGAAGAAQWHGVCGLGLAAGADQCGSSAQGLSHSCKYLSSDRTIIL